MVSYKKMILFLMRKKIFFSRISSDDRGVSQRSCIADINEGIDG